MSTALVKQTISGGELPTGDLVAYTREGWDGAIYAFKLADVGGEAHLFRRVLITFPPTAYDDATGWVDSGKVITNINGNSIFADCAQLIGATNMFTNIYRFGVKTTAGNILILAYQLGGAVSYSYTVANKPSFIAIVPNNYDATQIINPYYNTDNNNMPRAWGGFGKDAADSPVYNGFPATGTVVVGNSVQCYGHCRGFGSYANNSNSSTATNFFLLNKDTGLVGQELDKITFKLNMPAGGRVVSFGGGWSNYYLCADASNNMSLWQLQTATRKSGLVADLTGTYDPSLPVELLGTFTV